MHFFNFFIIGYATFAQHDCIINAIIRLTKIYGITTLSPM